LTFLTFCSVNSDRRDELQPMINNSDAQNDTLMHACAKSVDFFGEASLDPLLIKIVKNLQDMGLESTPNCAGQTPRDIFLSKGT